MKKVEEIRQKRANTHIMQRLRKGRELEEEKDIKEVQRNLCLIRSPAAGLKNKHKAEEAEDEKMEESEDSEVEAEAIAVEN